MVPQNYFDDTLLFYNVNLVEYLKEGYVSFISLLLELVIKRSYWYLNNGLQLS